MLAPIYSLERMTKKHKGMMVFYFFSENIFLCVTMIWNPKMNMYMHNVGDGNEPTFNEIEEKSKRESLATVHEVVESVSLDEKESTTRHTYMGGNTHSLVEEPHEAFEHEDGPDLQVSEESTLMENASQALDLISKYHELTLRVEYFYLRELVDYISHGLTSQKFYSSMDCVDRYIAHMEIH